LAKPANIGVANSSIMIVPWIVKSSHPEPGMTTITERLRVPGYDVTMYRRPISLWSVVEVQRSSAAPRGLPEALSSRAACSDSCVIVLLQGPRRRYRRDLHRPSRHALLWAVRAAFERAAAGDPSRRGLTQKERRRKQKEDEPP